MRLHRLKKKLTTNAKSSANTEQIESEYVYKTPQSLGNAVKKVSRQLPSSPKKRKAVISTLVETTKLTFNKPKDPNGNNQIPATTIEEVKELYFRGSISCQSPGRKDFVISSPHNVPLASSLALYCFWEMVHFKSHGSLSLKKYLKLDIVYPLRLDNSKL